MTSRKKVGIIAGAGLGIAADQVLRFVPLVATVDDFQRFNGTGERIRRPDADVAVGFYRTLLQRAGATT